MAINLATTSESLLEQVGLSRYDAFVTNAVLCNPKDGNGNNATPSPSEVANCAQFLKEQLDLVDAPVVVTLGAVALRACTGLQLTALAQKTACARPTHGQGVCSSRPTTPGQRAMVHRSFRQSAGGLPVRRRAVRRGGGVARRKPSVKLSRTSEKVGAAAGSARGRRRTELLRSTQAAVHQKSPTFRSCLGRLTEGYMYRRRMALPLLHCTRSVWLR